MERRRVIKVGVHGLRKIEWFEPHELEGREPTVFTVLLGDDGCYSNCGPYCAIEYYYPRNKGARRRAPQVEDRHFFFRIPRIKAALGADYTVETE